VSNDLPRVAEVRWRDATDNDAASLALLADAATRRLVAWSWDQSARPGQSGFEIGRDIIRSNEDSFVHLRHWRVGESEGRVASGLNSYLLPESDASLAAQAAPPLRPPIELKALAAGTWYVGAASVFPEFRNRGVGQALFVEAERLAALVGATQLTLLVGSFNHGAQRLYQRLGFTEWRRLPFIPFRGSDPTGDWILMGKNLGAPRA